MKLFAGILALVVAAAFGLYYFGSNLEPEVRMIDQEAENVRSE